MTGAILQLEYREVLPLEDASDTVHSRRTTKKEKVRSSFPIGGTKLTETSGCYKSVGRCREFRPPSD